MGPTRLFLEMCDLFSYLGHDVWVVGRTKKATRWVTPRGVITERLGGKSYFKLQKIRKYHPLKYIKDFTLAELPLIYPYQYMPRALETAIPRMDLVFADVEIYLPLGKYIPGNYLFYVHWPPSPIRAGRKPLMPEAPAKIWCNSNYTAQEIKRLWGPEWGSGWPPLDPQVVYPPLWTDMYDGSRGFESRPFDVVMFSRLYEDKFLVLPELKDFKVAVIGSDYGLKSIPSWVKVWKGAPLKTVIQVLGSSKVYVHSKGWGKMSSGAPCSPEHFGICASEAQAAGCPVVVPRAGGIWTDLAKEGEYGLGFGSVDELKSHISKLVSDEGYWNQWHNKSLESVKRFDTKAVAERVKYLLDQML